MTLFTADGLIRWRLASADGSRAELVSTVHDAYDRWLLTQRESRMPIGTDWLLSHKALYSRRAPGTTCLLALSVAVTHDGDSDSTGSIAGQILGAASGESVLPPAWRAELELHDTIQQVADDLYDCFVQGETGDLRKRYPG